jgi:hypothetical protein
MYGSNFYGSTFFAEAFYSLKGSIGVWIKINKPIIQTNTAIITSSNRDSAYFGGTYFGQSYFGEISGEAVSFIAGWQKIIKPIVTWIKQQKP